MNIIENFVMIVAGTRPEAIKLAPVLWWLDKLGVEYTFIWSGQHYEYEMSSIFFEQLNLPAPDEYLNVGSQAQDLASKVVILIQKIVDAIKRWKPKFVYALGDTNTTLASALASVYTSEPFVHDEAGMRSYDTSMIEEMNRRICDSIANFRLAPTKIAFLNLLNEGALPDDIRLVGSTVVDVLLYITSSKNIFKNTLLTDLNLEPLQYTLVTIHRRENLTESQLRKIVDLLTTVANFTPDHTFVMPVHPHTQKNLNAYGLYKLLEKYSNIKLIKPLGYIEFITLLKNSKVVITDSGGVQEEAFILGKRILTLRKTTEWIETVLLGYNTLLDINNAQSVISEVVNAINSPTLKPPELSTSPIGDGNAGKRVATILQRLAETKLERGISPSLLEKHSDRIFLCLQKNRKLLQEDNTFRSLTRIPLAPDPELAELVKVDWSQINE
jgi:UDP-N-acetylglucosamine 2-epimerase (non-hydrolysing)